MRIVLLTSARRGFASICLPLLAADPNIEVAMVLQSEGAVLHPAKHRRRKLVKIRKIGLLGALNGIRMRRWFNNDVEQRLHLEDIDKVAKRCDTRFETTPTINCQRTIDLLRMANADLGLSLGNSYIGQNVFRLPRFGMINVHHELLPEFRGAQSVIWQLYEGSLQTGYTIHQIDDRTDNGKILCQERLAIELKPSLRETVSHNYARLLNASSLTLKEVVTRYYELSAAALPQPASGRSFTTPSLREFIQISRQHRKLYYDSVNRVDMLSQKERA